MFDLRRKCLFFIKVLCCINMPVLQLEGHIFIHFIFQKLLYQLRTRILFLALFRLIAGQEHFTLDIDQRCCHNKELTHHIHIFRLHLPDISHVLIRNQYNRNIINIYFVFFDQMQEQIQRTLKYLQFYR